MIIHRNNYEAYVLDYLEDRLDADSCAAMEAFLSENSDVADSLVDLSDATLPSETDIIFEHKSSLCQLTQLIAASDAEFECWDNTQPTLPQERIPYPHKTTLYHKRVTLFSRTLTTLAVAASLILAIGFTAIFWQPTDDAVVPSIVADNQRFSVLPVAPIISTQSPEIPSETPSAEVAEVTTQRATRRRLTSTEAIEVIPPVRNASQVVTIASTIIKPTITTDLAICPQSYFYGKTIIVIDNGSVHNNIDNDITVGDRLLASAKTWIGNQIRPFLQETGRQYYEKKAEFESHPLATFLVNN
ncbi:hypothetical protein FACS1894201_06330 [Bacteroidia bacterium]|nr:hypothetical protein FACS1894201_06330 [Bacteroidia bacterium]